LTYKYNESAPKEKTEVNKNNLVSITSYRSNDTSAKESSQFAMTPQELEMIKMKMKNDKVVGFYKKVLTDIHQALSSERK
jgi:hypothetical protein